MRESLLHEGGANAEPENKGFGERIKDKMRKIYIPGVDSTRGILRILVLFLIPFCAMLTIYSTFGPRSEF
jgi:hypothetical protein